MKLVNWYLNLSTDCQILMPLLILALVIVIVGEIRSWIKDKKSLFF